MEGWVRFHRRYLDSDLWLSEPFTKGQAWVDLFSLANHKDGFIRIRGNRVEVKRGQVGWSQLKLSERWKWSRGKVRRFLDELENIDGKVVQQKTKVTTLINIINYELYQTGDTTDSTADGQQTDNRQYTNKNDKNVNNDNKDILAYISTDIISFSQDFIDYTKTEKGSLAPNGKNLLKNSADTIDKIIRLDDFSFEYIGVVIKWAVKDDFWSNNILSLHGLRKKSGNGLTKFQNIANGYEKSKIMVIPKNNRLNQNKEACKSFVEGAGDER